MSSHHRSRSAESSGKKKRVKKLRKLPTTKNSSKRKTTTTQQPTPSSNNVLSPRRQQRITALEQRIQTLEKQILQQKDLMRRALEKFRCSRSSHDRTEREQAELTTKRKMMEVLLSLQSERDSVIERLHKIKRKYGQTLPVTFSDVIKLTENSTCSVLFPPHDGGAKSPTTTIVHVSPLSDSFASSSSSTFAPIAPAATTSITPKSVSPILTQSLSPCSDGDDASPIKFDPKSESQELDALFKQLGIGVQDQSPHHSENAQRKKKTRQKMSVSSPSHSRSLLKRSTSGLFGERSKNVKKKLLHRRKSHDKNAFSELVSRSLNTTTTTTRHDQQSNNIAEYTNHSTIDWMVTEDLSTSDSSLAGDDWSSTSSPRHPSSVPFPGVRFHNDAAPKLYRDEHRRHRPRVKPNPRLRIPSSDFTQRLRIPSSDFTLMSRSTSTQSNLARAANQSLLPFTHSQSSIAEYRRGRHHSINGADSMTRLRAPSIGELSGGGFRHPTRERRLSLVGEHSPRLERLLSPSRRPSMEDLRVKHILVDQRAERKRRSSVVEKLTNFFETMYADPYTKPLPIFLDQKETQKHLVSILDDFMINYDHLEFSPTSKKAIGEGAYSEVFRATYQGKQVAVKRLRDLSKWRAAILRAFEREVVSLRRTTSIPEVVGFVGACVQPRYCVVTEFASNGSLHHLLYETDAGKRWSLLKALIVAKRIARGIYRLHTMDPPLLHRDLTSFNILMDHRERPVIGDFGISRFHQPDQPTSPIGHPRWKPPEIHKRLNYSTASDIYMYGTILFELTFRKKPFPPVWTDKQVSLRLIDGYMPPIPTRACKINVPEKLQSLIRQCWYQSPSKRPTAREIGNSLKSIIRQQEMNTFHDSIPIACSSSDQS